MLNYTEYPSDNTQRLHNPVLVYRSSAGSGKTFTLAKEYLKLVLLDPSRYKEILAITFTNDAKDEMKQRIVAELKAIAHGTDSDMLKAILNDFVTDGIKNISDVIQKRARRALDNILYDYSYFEIGTIDYFFTKLVRHLARELKLNLGYELDIDNDKALDEAVKMLFEESDPVIMKWLHFFAVSQIENDKSWNIELAIKDLGKELFKERFVSIRAMLGGLDLEALEKFIVGLQKTRRDFEGKLLKFANDAILLIEKHALDVNDFRANTASVFQRIKAGKFDISKGFSSTFEKATDPEQWHTKTSNNKEVIQAVVADGLGDIHTKLLELYELPFREYNEAGEILKNIYSYGVLTNLNAHLQTYRSENNVLLVSDTSSLLNGVIADGETPFIYEKLGARYRYILIDEFQDTSTFQWKNLLPLLRHALQDNGMVLIVGDIKQSIYRWRGGDMNLLLNQVDNDLNRFGISINHLNHNYRSGTAIIGFNNEFFKTAAPKLTDHFPELTAYEETLQNAYGDVVQDSKKEFEGYVEACLLGSKEEDWRELAKERTLSTINNCLKNGFAPGDIIILVEKTRRAVDISTFLLNKGHNIITDSALLLTQSIEVKFLIAILEYLKQNDNAVACAEITFFYRKLMSDHDDATASLAKFSVDETLIFSQHPNVRLEDLADRPVYEIVEELLLQFELFLTPNLFIQRFQDVVLDQATKGNSDLYSFLEWWTDANSKNDKKEISIAIPKSHNAIRVMTVHKSKGLEKPVVIVPFLDEKMRPELGVFWSEKLPDSFQQWKALPLSYSKKLNDTAFATAYEKELLETILEKLNVMYVAFTRAKEQLYLFGNANSRVGSESYLLEEIFKHTSFKHNTLYNEQEKIFKYGNNTNKISSDNESITTSSFLTTYPLYPLQDKLVATSNTRKYSKLFDDDSVSSPVKEGIQLHEIMSKLTRFENLDDVLNAYWQEGGIDADKRLILKSKVEKLFEKHQIFYEWFSEDWEVINEKKIAFGGRIYIPDRVMIRDNECIIIDYKSGRKRDSDKKQLNEYAALLTQMGFLNIKKYLVYTSDFTLQKYE